ncbi:MAG: FCD domain-containing protein, partial [Alphaproteobacteria bacterium]|nr:FCD domain-containing protein [Alphaproteobacteria bacterium]
MGKRAGKTLAEEVYKRLRADILTSRHPPGSSLRLDKLKTHYGVGVTPLREALSQLVARGLAVAEGQKGSRVASASVVELTDIASVRRDIEGIALRRSIEFGDDYWESNLVAARHRLILLERGNDSEESNKETWETRHREFHEHLIAGCNSPWLMHLNGILYDQFDRYRNFSTKYYLSAKAVSLEHQEIMDAALARDTKLAVNLL